MQGGNARQRGKIAGVRGGRERQCGKTTGVRGSREREADLSPECHTDVIMPQPYIPIFVGEKEKKTETATSKLFSGFTRGNARFSPTETLPFPS